MNVDLEFVESLEDGLSEVFHTADDPMISSRARAVRDAGPSVEHRVVARGGHLGFRPRARIDDQMVDWLRTHTR